MDPTSGFKQVSYDNAVSRRSVPKIERHDMASTQDFSHRLPRILDPRVFPNVSEYNYKSSILAKNPYERPDKPGEDFAWLERPTPMHFFVFG